MLQSYSKIPTVALFQTSWAETSYEDRGEKYDIDILISIQYNSLSSSSFHIKTTTRVEREV